MSSSRRTHSDPLVWSLRGRLAALVGVLLALLGGWLVFGWPAGDEAAALPSATLAPKYQLIASPPTAPKYEPTASPSTSPVSPAATRPPASTPSAARSANAGQGSPTRILLPQIAVSAQVIPIVAEGGSLIPPSNPRVVGWWSEGARPGATTGSAVLTAHTVHTGGGAFDDLDKLRVGATVTVITSTGRITYVATSVTNYPKRSLAKHSAELFDQTTRPRLVLVTCEDWNGKTYLSNAVVIAEPIG
jgi:LPXTG-site transpeptidase (sortase) family protein